MREQPNVPEVVGARVAAALDNAERQAAILLADAERRAARVRPADAGKLRGELTDRIERLETVHSRVVERRRRVPARLHEIAAALGEISAELAAPAAPSAEQPGFERALSPSGGEGAEARGDPHWPQLNSVLNAAQAAAKAIVEDARERARQANQLARREADEIASERQLAGTLDPTAREADSLRGALEDSTRSLARALASTPIADEETARS